jgi:hypothetical protein
MWVERWKTCEITTIPSNEKAAKDGPRLTYENDLTFHAHLVKSY